MKKAFNILLLTASLQVIFIQLSVCFAAKGTTDYVFQNPNIDIETRILDLTNQLTIDEKISLLRYNSPAISRLGIPAYNWWNEALHGVARFGRATVFPEPIGMAATFDPDLIFRVADAISDEVRAKHNAAIQIGSTAQYTGLSVWAPNINIFRDARWGRGMETYGEDPYLTSQMGVAFVKGLQGDDPIYLKTAACAKHYAVHSGPESERHKFNAIVDQKDLYETYLPAFEAVVKNGVASVMGAYNRVNGDPSCASKLLLTDILRDKWQFKGQILSDCGAIKDFNEGHKVTQNIVQSAAMALKAGVNLNCGDAYRSLPEALKEGLITENDINIALIDNLRVRFRLGLFDKTNRYNNISPNVVGSVEHKKLAREAAQKSIVLLKNSGILPLSKNIKQLYVIGPNAADVDVLLGNYNGQTDDARTIIEGLTSKVSLGTRLEYRKGFMYDELNKNKSNYAFGEVKGADVVIAVVGMSTLSEGEEGDAIASDFKSDRKTLSLPESQMKYLHEIRALTKKPLIIVVTGGSPINLTEISEMADALLFVWYPGQAGGDAVADVIFGDVSPSGKLPITFPKSEAQLPEYTDYSMVGRTYKYMVDEPQYPFGFGLGYAKMNLGELNVNKDKFTKNDTIILNSSLTNNSNFPAEEVIQMYVKVKGAPFRTPNLDLKQFKRIAVKSNGRELVQLKVPVSALSSINLKGEKVLVKGQYELFLGTSQPTQRSKDLGAMDWREKTISVK